MSPGRLWGFPTPGNFRTPVIAARIFKACKPLPWRQTCVTLGLSLNLTCKAEALGPT